MIPDTHIQQFLLISIIPQKMTEEDAFNELKEVKLLVDTYGGKIADWLLQRREVHDKGHYIGEGKMYEAGKLIKEKHVDVVVLNEVIKPGQLYDFKNVLMKTKRDIEVWDKVDLILKIFAKHASTAEARLQIELAAMRHMGPRIYGMGMEMSRQSGGIGTRGVGETNTELMRRHWREQMKKTRDRLIKLSEDRERQLDRRRKMGLPTVSLIGYTNAGKTSLFNMLTGKKKKVQNALFVTLDSAVGKIYLPEIHKEILISDTIGFIRHLPTNLIQAFRSTLLESVFADVLLHVIDASDEEVEDKISVVENVLCDLGLQNRKKIYIFNKVDACSTEQIEHLEMKYSEFTPQFISVKSGKNIDTLLTSISEQLATQQHLTV